MRNGENSGWGSRASVGDPSPYAVLTMRQGPKPGQRFIIRKGNITIGRLPANDVSIPDQQVSRHHATITWENEQFFIRDLGSANGTTVNGVLISAPCPLRDGDVIGLGEILLTFQGPGAGIDSESRGASRVPYRTAAPRNDPTWSSRQVRAAQPASTIGMDSTPVGKRRDNGSVGILWPILIGVSLAIFLALIFTVVIVLLVFSQTPSVPELAVQQPLNGSQARVGEPVLILASASDRKGVSRVEVWINGVLSANITSNSPAGQPVLPVQYPWTPTSGGLHNISLKAYNVAGNVSEPANITVGVVDIPRVQPAPSQQPSPTPTAAFLALATPPPTNTPIVLLTPTFTPQSCTNDAAFVADVTVPDNTIFQPGARIDKTWRIRNSGTCPWGPGYRLVFSSGNKMGAPDSQPVVPTAPGGTTDVTVTMYAPRSYGVHTGVWRMVDPSGQPFGGRFTIVIQIPSPDTPTPVATPTFTPLPGPVIVIWADPDRVNAGECTTVRAQVEGVKAAWLDGEPIAGGYREKRVCPCENTRYVLTVDLPGGKREERDTTVQVEGTCIVPKPDLEIREFQVMDREPKAKKGETIQIRIKIKNVGSEPARDFVVAWLPKGEGSETVFTKRVDELAPGESKDWKPFVEYAYPEAGEFESFAKVDYTNELDEANEGNNTRTLTIEVSEP